MTFDLVNIKDAYNILKSSFNKSSKMGRRCPGEYESGRMREERKSVARRLDTPVRCGLDPMRLQKGAER